MATIIHTPRNTSKWNARFDVNTKEPVEMPSKDPKWMPTPHSTPTPNPSTY